MNTYPLLTTTGSSPYVVPQVILSLRLARVSETPKASDLWGYGLTVYTQSLVQLVGCCPYLNPYFKFPFPSAIDTIGRQLPEYMQPRRRRGFP
jgi:serine/threonine protein kinase